MQTAHRNSLPTSDLWECQTHICGAYTYTQAKHSYTKLKCKGLGECTHETQELRRWKFEVMWRIRPIHSFNGRCSFYYLSKGVVLDRGRQDNVTSEMSQRTVPFGKKKALKLCAAFQLDAVTAPTLWGLHFLSPQLLKQIKGWRLHCYWEVSSDR